MATTTRAPVRKTTPTRAAPAKAVRAAPAKAARAAPAKAPIVKKGPFGRPATGGTGRARPAVKRKPVPTFKAPADFKPHFLLVELATSKDSLLASSIEATRYMGRFDRAADERKMSNLKSYDVDTLIGIQARFSAICYRANAEKVFSASPKERAASKGAHRLPASTGFQVLLRINRKVADQTLSVGVKGIFQVAVNPKTGREVPRELLKTDPVYRTLRKAARILPAAFAQVLMPPKRTRKSKAEEE